VLDLPAVDEVLDEVAQAAEPVWLLGDVVRPLVRAAAPILPEAARRCLPRDRHAADRPMTHTLRCLPLERAAAGDPRAPLGEALAATEWVEPFPDEQLR
jgi:hypothetical protein